MNDNQRYIGLFGNRLTSIYARVALGISCLLWATPVLAHHPAGGKTPSNLIEGLLSGLGHPVIGIDHLVFAIALGLLAVVHRSLGLIIPSGFMAATVLGTAIHVQEINLPLGEVAIATSVLIAGIVLAKTEPMNLMLLAIMGTMAGIFHGYAYGEAIVGAETTALGGYLLGFALIQLAISFGAYGLGRSLLPSLKDNNLPNLTLRFAGCTIAGIGLAFLSKTILS